MDDYTSEGSCVAVAAVCTRSHMEIIPCDVALSSWETLQQSFQVFVTNENYSLDARTVFGLF